MNSDKKTVFLIGAKSLGAYGGYETFIDKLTEYHQDDARIKYYVACKKNGDGSMNPFETEGVQIISDDEFIYHNANCFRIGIPEKLGPAQAIYYDLAALNMTCRIIEENKIDKPVIYIMACRIGPFMQYFYKRIHKLGGIVYLNPDGHEWKRVKWNAAIRKYWKLSESLMVKWSDLVICDSLTIEKYIHASYDGKGIYGRNPKTTFIAYGAETRPSIYSDDDPKFLSWLSDKNLHPNDYYLVVGRFVPENNYEIMIREFMRSESSKSFALITNVNEKFLSELENKLHFSNDKRIKFVGTVYDKELLMKIREKAYAYFHGHEVGGTNPSLLEALGSTKLNLLLDVGFNREVAGESALYWTKDSGSLASLINEADRLDKDSIESYGDKAKHRIKENYSWEYICDKYADAFLKNKGE